MGGGAGAASTGWPMCWPPEGDRTSLGGCLVAGRTNPLGGARKGGPVVPERDRLGRPPSKPGWAKGGLGGQKAECMPGMGGADSSASALRPRALCGRLGVRLLWRIARAGAVTCRSGPRAWPWASGRGLLAALPRKVGKGPPPEVNVSLNYWRRTIIG